MTSFSLEYIGFYSAETALNGMRVVFYSSDKRLAEIGHPNREGTFIVVRDEVSPTERNLTVRPAGRLNFLLHYLTLGLAVKTIKGGIIEFLPAPTRPNTMRFGADS